MRILRIWSQQKPQAEQEAAERKDQQKNLNSNRHKMVLRVKGQGG